MKVFLSYRRDDTGGRAGRLADVFVARYGPRNVFQDVESAAPGLDFVARVDTAIADSDVVLVVIGTAWLGSAEADGQRRIDHTDDFVRHEIRVALDAGIRVVPVLVDGATLPTADQLPVEIAPLLRRQAVNVRDVSWHQDVEDLIRRLEGGQTAFVDRTRRRWPLIAAGAFAVGVAIVVVVILIDDDHDDADSGGDALTSCPEPDQTWTPIDVVDDDSVTHTYDTNDVEIDIVGAWTTTVDAATGVYVETKVTNRTEPDATTNADDFYVNEAPFGGLLIDGVDQGDAWCILTGPERELEPGEATPAMLGYAPTADPSGATISIEAFGDDVDLAVTRP